MPKSSSPFATGGGGYQHERDFAASALAALLLGHPLPGLGEEYTPISVAMQQSAVTDVDDVVICGRSPAGGRELHVACRTKPRMGKSDQPTVKLFAAYLRIALEQSQALAADRLRLGLAVAGPHAPTLELARLSDVARVQSSSGAFQTAINTPKSFTKEIRERLRRTQEVVAAALDLLKQQGDTAELTWLLLRSLFVIDLRLEGDAAAGRTELVARLQTLTGSADVAERLRLRLVEIAGTAAIRGGGLTRSGLRRLVSSIGLLHASPDFAFARPRLELLEQELRRRTPAGLPRRHGLRPLVLGRRSVQRRLVQAICSAPSGTVVLVHGEPDVGKSALALGAIDAIRKMGGDALAMSLRDIPSAVGDLLNSLGLTPSDLFGAAPSGPTTALLLDGAEVVQEQRGGSLAALVAASVHAGRTIVLVVRDDALELVRECIKQLKLHELVSFSVPALDDQEIVEMVAAIPELVPLSTDARSAWLLRRLGIVELLLRAFETGAAFPTSLASEADVFDAVWSGLVRQHSLTVDGVSPDDREAALLAVARSLLTGTHAPPPSGGALAQLRSDGILLPLAAGAAWRSRESFASDVLRDFATARLLLVHGLGVLIDSSAPRWAIRAARLFAQARLAESIVANRALPWGTIQQEFDVLAQQHGARWAELPWEALLTAGWADLALVKLTESLRADRSQRASAIRCVMLHMTEDGACEPWLGAPLVGWLVNHGYFAPQHYGDDDSVSELVLYWLRGVARAELVGRAVSQCRPIRQHIRDRLVATSDDWHPGSLIECLGLLGVDTDSASIELLEDAATHKPHSLVSLVESGDVARSLSHWHTKLLARLSTAYYIEASPATGFVSIADDGIRSHGRDRLGAPLAAWYRGPFFWLLKASSELGLQVINRMVDAGASAREYSLRQLETPSATQGSAEQSGRGLSLALLGLPKRWLAGDDHVWLWYRGSGVGPYPCMSALLSLELFLDAEVRAGQRPGDLARAVLNDASTLATPGLIYGFLVRHIDSVTDELDDFLAEPQIWLLEFQRVVKEGQFHVQGGEPKTLAALDRRNWEPTAVAMHLVIAAQRRGDDMAIARLKHVGERLLQAAGDDKAPAEAKLWAAHLDAAQYAVEPHDTHHVVKVRPPEEVRRALAKRHAAIVAFRETMRLMNRYRLHELTPYFHAPAVLPAGAELLADISAGQMLWADRERSGVDLLFLVPAVAGLAASLAAAAARGEPLAPEYSRWAIDQLMDSLLTGDENVGFAASEYTLYGDGADRKAALVLPLALSNTDLSDRPGSAKCSAPRLERMRQAVRICTTTPVLEVRERAGEGCSYASEIPCGATSAGGCWHEFLWEAIEAGIRTILLGQPGASRPTEIAPIQGELESATVETAPGSIMFAHFTPMVTCVVHVARGQSCLAARARSLRESLLDIWAATASWWAANDFQWREEQVTALASSLLRTQALEGPGWIERVARALQDCPPALADYLRALALAATYEIDLVRVLQEAWPRCMAIGLAALRDGSHANDHFDVDRLKASLVPGPHPSSHLKDFQAIMDRARQHWLGMSAVQEHIEEWLMVARGKPDCVYALVTFLETQPLDMQAGPGLSWMRKIVVREDGFARTAGLGLVSWLRTLRDRLPLSPAAGQDYRALVDALALNGSAAARELQMRDE